MDKKTLTVVSICAVVLLVLGSLSNVVGYYVLSTRSTVNDSPLFQTRTQRATNQQQNNITSRFLGKGTNVISFSLQDTTTEMIQKLVDRIKAMDDDTFNRFIDNVVNQINHKNSLKDVKINDFIKGLRQIRESTQDIIINEESNDSKMFISHRCGMTIFRYWDPVQCWFPGKLLLLGIGILLAPIIVLYSLFFCGVETSMFMSSCC